MSRRIVHWLIAVTAIVVVLLVADRVGAVVASNAAEHYLAQQASFTQRPDVTIRGFPFLTQAVEGRYRDVRVRGDVVTVEGVPATDLHAELHGVHLPLSSLFGGKVTSLAVDEVTGSLTFSYPELARLTQIPGLNLTESGGQLQVSATLAIPGLNITTNVTGTGSVRLDNGTLRLSVAELTVAGVSAPASVLSALETTLGVAIAIPALPYGLHVTTVTPTSGGVIVGGAASHAVIGPT